LPARFQLVTAMNRQPLRLRRRRHSPLPLQSPTIQRYRARLSGPLLNRLDLHLRIQSTEVATLLYSPWMPSVA
jgi:magnesium chelatase family protein